MPLSVAKALPDDWAGDPRMSGDRKGVAGVVVDPGQDFGVCTGPAVGVGEPVVGEIGLPALVGLFGLEADVGRLRSFAGLGDDQGLDGQVPGDGGRRDGDPVGVLQCQRIVELPPL